MLTINRSALGLLWAMLFMCGVSGAAEFMPGIEVHESGFLEVAGLRMEVMAYDKNWGFVKQDSLQRKDGYPESNGNSWKVQGVLPMETGAKLELAQVMTKDGNTLNYQSLLSSDSPRDEFKSMAFCINLPTGAYAGKSLQADGAEIKLPEAQGSQDVASVKAVKVLVIPVEGGAIRLEGDFGVYVQDLRQYNAQFFTVRVGFTKVDGGVTSSLLNLKITLEK